MWLPTWRPRFADHQRAARIYLDLNCQPCGQLAKWLERRRPRSLQILPADQHARKLVRMTYEDDVNDQEQPYSCCGIVALARALEHVNLGWAFVGLIIRLPGLHSAIQVLVDAVGGGPRSQDEQRTAR